MDGGECGEAQNDREAKLHDICEENDDREMVSKCWGASDLDKQK